MYRYAVALLVMKIHLCLLGLTVIHRLLQRTSFQAKGVPLLIDMYEDIVRATGAENFIRVISRDSLSPFVPIENLPIAIDKIDALMKLVEDGTMKVRLFL